MDYTPPDSDSINFEAITSTYTVPELDAINFNSDSSFSDSVSTNPDRTTDLSITLASLGNISGRQSDSIDNSDTKYLDVLISGFFTTNASATADNFISVHAFGSADGGTTFSDGATGIDGSWIDGFNSKTLEVINTDDTDNKTYEFGPVSLAKAFGGRVPRVWSIGVYNGTGSSLHATEANHLIRSQGIKYDTSLLVP